MSSTSLFYISQPYDPSDCWHVHVILLDRTTIVTMLCIVSFPDPTSKGERVWWIGSFLGFTGRKVVIDLQPDWSTLPHRQFKLTPQSCVSTQNLDNIFLWQENHMDHIQQRAAVWLGPLNLFPLAQGFCPYLSDSFPCACKRWGLGTRLQCTWTTIAYGWQYAFVHIYWSHCLCCICSQLSGHNAATLHYGHAGEPNSKTITDGDMW